MSAKSDNSSKSFMSIGLMSGTSMDGIDVALLETDGLTEINELGHHSLDYSPSFKIALKAAEYAVRQAKGNLRIAEHNFPQSLKQYLSDELKQSNSTKFEQELQEDLKESLGLQQIIKKSTLLHAEAVKGLLSKLKLSAADIDVVGYHGQALFHQPSQGISIIVGDGQLLAKELGIAVVNDFRSNDIAHGGQGAPFAPLYHLALCQRDHLTPAAVINCGGITNITFIPDNHAEHLIAFDVGAGNGLIDRLVRQRTAGMEHMDKNGHYGKQGKVHELILEKLFEKAVIKNNKNYFVLRPPKSLDIGDLQLIPELEKLSLEDACRSLEAFTAEALVRSLDLVSSVMPDHWILAGGGWNNPVILEELRIRLSNRLNQRLQIKTADEVGWNSQALEAQIFAYLAVRSLKQLALSMPGTTGVARSLSGGKINNPHSEI